VVCGFGPHGVEMQRSRTMFHYTKNNLSRVMTKINKCHRCGATSYKTVIKRDENGTMMPSGEHQCVGCGLVFTDIDEWRTAPIQKEEIQTEGQDRQ